MVFILIYKFQLVEFKKNMQQNIFRLLVYNKLSYFHSIIIFFAFKKNPSFLLLTFEETPIFLALSNQFACPIFFICSSTVIGSARD